MVPLIRSRTLIALLLLAVLLADAQTTSPSSGLGAGRAAQPKNRADQLSNGRFVFIEGNRDDVVVLGDFAVAGDKARSGKWHAPAKGARVVDSEYILTLKANTPAEMVAKIEETLQSLNGEVKFSTKSNQGWKCITFKMASSTLGEKTTLLQQLLDKESVATVEANQIISVNSRGLLQSKKLKAAGGGKPGGGTGGGKPPKTPASPSPDPLPSPSPEPEPQCGAAPVAPAFTQSSASYGLSGIDQRGWFDASYRYTSTGEGVDVYVIDTGINLDHAEFEGRAKYGYNFVEWHGKTWV